MQVGSVVTDLALADFQGASGLQPFQFPVDYPQMRVLCCQEEYSGAMAWYDKVNCRTAEQLQEILSTRPGGFISQSAMIPTTLKT